MNEAKRKRLEKAGWKAGSAADFLGLSPEEAAYIELKIALGDYLAEKRKESGLTQADLANRLHSSQSRVAKMEKADTSVSTDLLIRSLYALGVENPELAAVVAEATPEYAVEKSGGKKNRKTPAGNRSASSGKT